MYALIRQYDGLDIETRNDATRKANLELRPLIAKSPGFVSYELMNPDDRSDSVASISVFKTRAEADASHTVAEAWVRENLPAMSAPTKVGGECVAH
jgi:hypothetical protein